MSAENRRGGCCSTRFTAQNKERRGRADLRSVSGIAPTRMSAEGSAGGRQLVGMRDGEAGALPCGRPGSMP